MHHPVLVLRLAPRPVPDRTGDLATDLRARQRHAATVRWIPAPAEGLTPDTAREWAHGGHRLGLVFIGEGGRVFLPHPAPGEIAATCALAGDGLTPWVCAIADALSTGRARLEISGERFELRLGPASITLSALDLDGTEESRIQLDRRQIGQQLVSAVGPLAAISQSVQGTVDLAAVQACLIRLEAP